MSRFFWGWLLPASLAGGVATLLAAAAAPLLQRWGFARLSRALCGFALLLFCLAPAAGLLPARGAGGMAAGMEMLPGAGGASAPAAAGPMGAFGAPGPLPGKAPAAPQQAAAQWADPAGLLQTAGLAWLPGAAAGAWAVGAGVLALFWGGCYGHFRRQLRRAASPADGQLAAAYRQAAAGLKHPPRRLPPVWVCPGASGPALVGVLRPVVLLPQGACSEGALAFALQHELQHLRAGDPVRRWAALAVTALHWFNPAAWLLAALLARSCEAACDAAVAGGLTRQGRLAYGAALLDFYAAGRPAVGVPFSAAGRRLKRRLEMILKEKKRGPTRAAAALSVALVVLLGGLLAACGAGGMAASAAQPDAGQAPARAAAAGAQPSSSSAPANEGETGEAQGAQPGESDRYFRMEEGDPAGSHSAASPAGGAEGAQPGGSDLFFPVGEGYTHISRDFTPSPDGERAGHSGVDFAAPTGTTLYAAADGRVAAVGQDPTAPQGLYLWLDHSDGLQSRYEHCSALLVEEGAQVTAGQAIALSGNTGASTGPHCHFELRAEGEPVDPGEYFEQLPKGEDSPG